MCKRIIALLSLAIAPTALIAQAPSLTIHVNQPTAKVSPMLYGLMTEEINFSYDGGLYAELVSKGFANKDFSFMLEMLRGRA